MNDKNNIQLLRRIFQLQEGSFQNALLQQRPQESLVKDQDSAEEVFEEEDEPTIIKMLESMLPRKLLLSELLAMNNEVSIEDLKSEIKSWFFKDRALKTQKILDIEWEKRAERLDSLLDKIIKKKLQHEQENRLEITLAEKDKLEREQLANPFYTTLKAQKEERDQFMKLYNLGEIDQANSLPYVITNMTSSFDKNEVP